MGKGNLYHVTHAILEGRTRKAQSRTSENEIAKEKIKVDACMTWT